MPFVSRYRDGTFLLYRLKNQHKYLNKKDIFLILFCLTPLEQIRTRTISVMSDAASGSGD